MAEKGATNKYSVHLIDRIQQKCVFLIGAKNLKILYEKNGNIAFVLDQKAPFFEL